MIHVHEVWLTKQRDCGESQTRRARGCFPVTITLQKRNSKQSTHFYKYHTEQKCIGPPSLPPSPSRADNNDGVGEGTTQTCNHRTGPTKNIKTQPTINIINDSPLTDPPPPAPPPSEVVPQGTRTTTTGRQTGGILYTHTNTLKHKRRHENGKNLNF